MIYLMTYYCLVCWVAGMMLKDSGVFHDWLEVLATPLIFPYRIAEFIAYEVKSIKGYR